MSVSACTTAHSACRLLAACIGSGSERTANTTNLSADNGHTLAAFTGRGPWKRRIPQILEALAALGRARVVNGLWTLG